MAYETTVSERRTIWGLTRAQALLVGGLLAAYAAALLWINCVSVPYPDDNDLAKVGWLVEHLSLSRPESLANQVYPPGLPVVLLVLRPIFGVLRAAFVWQVLAVTVALVLLFRSSLALFKSWWAALLTLLCGITASTMVATSEFADGTATALLLCGLCALVIRAADGRGFFLLGIGAGLSYLFRVHYLIWTALVPFATLLAGYGVRTTIRRSVLFLAGFAAAAWPLWLFNLLAYGAPLHAKASQYNIALFMPDGVDWDDYLNTYNRWPLTRIIRERPRELAHHVIESGRWTLQRGLSVAGFAMGSVAALCEKDRERRRLIFFVGLLALLYVGTVIAPTLLTERAYFPVAMLASLLVGGGLAHLRSRLPASRLTSALALIWALFFGYPPYVGQRLRNKRVDLQYNRRIVSALVGHGMTKSEEVFCNDWELYNLADPKFIGFYNYGGWMLLDSRFRAERPPPRATTLRQWQSFFSEHGIHFAIMRRRPDNEEIFVNTPVSWKRIFEEGQFTIFKLDAP